MVWDNCNVVLHTASYGIFYTNNIVTGSVVLEIKKECKIGQIDFKVKGTCQAKWTRPSPTIPYIKIYTEKKEIFCVIVDVFGELKGVTLQPGILTRQFHFYLPPDLPPSFQDSIATVNYRIKIRSKSFYISSKKMICPVNVVNQVDLNNQDEFKIPLLYEATKNIGKTKKVSLAFKTFKGFTSRQLIPFEAILTNAHQVKVKSIKVYLIQKIEYNVTSGYYNTEKTMCRSVYRDILKIPSQSCHFHMEIPSLLPSTLNVTDPMVTISYLLRVKVSFWFHFALLTDIPVTISTIPINYS